MPEWRTGDATATTRAEAEELWQAAKRRERGEGV